MNYKRTFILAKIIQILMLNSAPVMGSTPARPNWPLTCHCPRANQTWVIHSNKITIKPDQERPSERFRHLASGPVEIMAVRTHQTADGFSKVINLNGQQMTFGLDQSQQSAYLAIRNPEGHEVMYPMDCQ